MIITAKPSVTIISIFKNGSAIIYDYNMTTKIFAAKL